ncbi:amino acid permease [Massilia sp. Dwa41.01b]|uniref:amino acid permease n=1 Tax=unclassified Massilia TaxID=2609279 RepID=UPI0016032F37|nr:MULTISPECIES: amino acid permease [unclassified Massilia]QNA89145.1 amino acid permease [Massilia sp. Dwa41.01b]QNB00038.1 amino acid permease [Massilia sp. Se16.2.3]
MAEPTQHDLSQRQLPKQKEAAQQLRRGLKSRHIQLIALGGAIGTGLFLGIGQTIPMAGPAALLGYGIAGIIAFLIMRQLAELVVDEPVAGSVSHFADKYGGHMAGFVAGWNYWVMYVLVSMAELSAVGIYVQYWFPQVPAWESALIFFVLVNSLSLLNVRAFGELEFWFAVIKVVAVVGMILFGIYLLASGTGGPQAGVANLWRNGGFFPNGAAGLAMSMAVIMFSFGGLELIGITAAEADDPARSIPRATNQALYRVLIFYIGALFVLLSLYPWQRVGAEGSPFVLIFDALDSKFVAHALNFVVLTAALSVYNSAVYANTRMLYGLAVQGNAPRALLKLSRNGAPVVALAVSAFATLVCISVNYFMPREAFGLMMGLAVAGLIINWATISIVHMRFRTLRAGKPTGFPSPLHPFSNWLCLAFLAGILAVMYLTPGLRVSVYLIPAWLLLLCAGYALRRRGARTA